MKAHERVKDKKTSEEEEEESHEEVKKKKKKEKIGFRDRKVLIFQCIE